VAAGDVALKLPLLRGVERKSLKGHSFAESAVIGAAIDLLCFGRACIDLYGEQIGAPLSAVESFAKSVGGSAANICVGSARLGLRTAMLTRVGNEELGRFVLTPFEREGVNTALVQLDELRPTAAVALAVRASDSFPRIFLCRDSPDLAVDPGLVDFAEVRRASTVLLTGTMLSKPTLAALSRRLADEVRDAGGRVAFDADFRPVLWGLVPIGKANVMEAHSASVSAAYLQLLGSCDLVVGTEEEMRAMAGTDDLAEALTSIRECTDATVVVKSGALGATAYLGSAPLSAAVNAPGFDVDVLNTVGAGDGFLSGFLSRWVRGESTEECLRAGNAAGALVATRHDCMSAMPVAAELDEFLARGGVRRPQDDECIQRLHRLGTRRPTPNRLFVLAMDHRWQLEELANEVGASYERLRPFKALLAKAFSLVAEGRDDCGILVDEQYGTAVLEQMAGTGVWVARSMDVARSRPVRLLAGDEIQSSLRTWPTDHVVKVMCYAHPTDSEEVMGHQLDRLALLTRACAAAARELLVELQPPDGSTYQPRELVMLIERLYSAEVRPEWWKLPPLPTREAWIELNELLEGEDPTCRGVLVLGSTASRSELASRFGACAGVSCMRGFAIGRALFSESAREWLAGEMEDGDVVRSVAAGYGEMISAWNDAESVARGSVISA